MLAGSIKNNTESHSLGGMSFIPISSGDPVLSGTPFSVAAFYALRFTIHKIAQVSSDISRLQY